MKILAFDTSNGELSVALLEAQQILQLIHLKENGKQAEMLVPTLEKILRDNKIWYNDLALIATIKGPGSFTGVRIGLACAKALQITTNLPLIALDSLAVMAFKHRAHNGAILATIDAKMGEFFVAEFYAEDKNLTRLTKSRLVTDNEFREICAKHDFICGNALNKEDVASADLIGLMAYEEFLKQDGIAENNSSNPSYLRLPKISKRKK